MPALDWPALRSPAEFDMWIEYGETINTGENGVEEVARHYTRWRASGSFAIMTVAQALAIEAFLNGLADGASDLIKVPFFKYRTMVGTASGSVTVNGAHAAGATSVAVSGVSGSFAAGDHVEITKVTGYPRLYRVVTAGAATLAIQPPLRTALAGGETVHHLGTRNPLRCSMYIPSDGFGSAARFPSPQGNPLVRNRPFEFVEGRRAGSI